MSADSYFLTQTVNFLIIARIMFLWMKGTYTQRDTEEAVKLLLVVVAAALVSDFVVTEARAIAGKPVTFACNKITGGLWECAGWPVIWDTAAHAIGSFLAFMQPGLGVPAAAAGLIAQAYLARQLSSKVDFHWRDAMNFFFWTFLVYLALFNLDWVLEILTTSIEKLRFFSSRVDDGKEVLKSWLATAMPYLDMVTESISLFNPKYLLVGLGIGLVGLVTSLMTFCIVAIIFFLLAFIPLATFKDVLSDEGDKLRGFIKRVLSILFLTIIKDINWTLISFFPALPEPTYVNGRIVLSGTTAFQILGLCTSFLVVLGFVYGICFLIGKTILRRVFS